MSRPTTLIAALATIPLLFGLAGCAAGDTAGAETETETVTIGVVGKSDPQWSAFETAAAEAGITLDIVDFADYNQPNPATTAGEVDLTQFQHIIYLAQYNVSAGEDLVPLGSTAIYPLALYSSQVDSVDEIVAGDTIAIPDDPSNLARSLLVLQSAGLVSLKDGGSIFSTVDDIESDSTVEVVTLEASLIPSSLADVTAAIINNDFVEGAGLTFDDAIAQDDPTDPKALPYVNIFATRAEDADNETYTKLVEIFQNTPEVQAGVLEASGNTANLLQTPLVDLDAALAAVESDIADQQ